MKKLVISILLLAVFVSTTNTLSAKEKNETRIAVLNETFFVVVQPRESDNSSVILYQVFDGKLHVRDALVVDGDFTDVSRPTLRVLRVTAK